MDNRFGADGKPLDKTYLERNLPQYLRHDLDALEEGYATGSTLLDCLWCEVYGSINSAEVDQEISHEQAEYLRVKYLDRKEN